MKKLLILFVLQITVLMAYTIKEGVLIPQTTEESFVDDPFVEEPMENTNLQNGQNGVSSEEWTPRPLPEKKFNVLNYGLRGDGRTDDTAALKRLAQNRSVTNWYFPAGHSFLLCDVSIPSHVNALFGGGTIISKGNTDKNGAGRGAFRIVDKHNGLVLDGLHFVTQKSSEWPKPDLSYNGVSGNAWRWYGHIVMSGEVELKNIEIRNCSFDMKNFKFNAIKVTGGSGTDPKKARINYNLRIYNNKITNYGEFGIEIIAAGASRRPDSRTLEFCHIYNNVFAKGGSAISFIMIRGGNPDGSPNGTESYIYNNTIKDGARWGIELGGTRGVHVHHNYMVGLKSRAISKSGESSIMRGEGKNFWYNNHIELDHSADYKSQFEMMSSTDEFFGNYLRGYFNFRQSSAHQPVMGYWHDNTLVIDDGDDKYTTIVMMDGIKNGVFENNDVYASIGVARGISVSRTGGGKTLKILNNRFYLKNKNAICIDDRYNPVTKSNNICKKGWIGNIPKSRSGAGLLK